MEAEERFRSIEERNEDILNQGNTPIGRSQRTIPDVYALRQAGRNYCITEGSSHYRIDGIEPLEFAIANGRVEDFAVTNVHKYIERFTTTRNPEDLKKVVDYAQILCGIELKKKEEEV